MEIWKDIKGYEGLYQVSNEGRVKSLEREAMASNRYGKFTRKQKAKILKYHVIGKGYLGVRLSKDNIVDDFTVHKLVAIMFIPNPENKPCIGHRDCDPTNNTVENLYWCTYQENNNHPTTRERQSKAKQGGKSYFAHRVITSEERERISNMFSKKVYQYTLDGDFVKEWKSASECGRNGYNTSTICSCCNGKRKTANGYKWSYQPL